MKKILIVEARFYNHISDLLLAGAIQEIKNFGYDYEVLTVLGALEIAPAISIIEKNSPQKYLGYVALGCVIRGETTHYDHVATETIRSLTEMGWQKQIAIGNGVITVENEQQAIARADITKKNKGGFATKACLNTIKIKQDYSSN